MSGQPVSNEAHDAHGVNAKGYITGFVLSLILTIIPFALVMMEMLSKPATIACVILAAVVQLLVQLYYFLHLDSSPKGLFNTWSFIFTAIIVFIVVGGSIWIMWNLNMNMML